MEKTSIKQWRIGQQVTCKHAVTCYAPSEAVFTPGTVGVIASIAPKVCKPKRGTVDPRYDRNDYFLVVDWQNGNRQERTSLNLCNTVAVK